MILVETMLPVKYNNGERIPTVVIENILLMIGEAFGGYTISAPGHGFWVGPTGRHYYEPNQTLRVAIAESRLEEARAMVRGIGVELGQESMYFCVLGNVDFLQVKP